jgi:hypothetical protein
MNNMKSPKKEKIRAPKIKYPNLYAKEGGFVEIPSAARLSV